MTGSDKEAQLRLVVEETNAAMRGKPRWVWAPVPGARHLVACDHGGLILARERIVNGRRYPEGLLDPAITGRCRYWQVQYTDDEGVRRKRPVHHLILEAHRGPRPPGMEGCHNDGDLNNNDLANLRWDTEAANRADRWGRHPRSRLRGAAKWLATRFGHRA